MSIDVQYDKMLPDIEKIIKKHLTNANVEKVEQKDAQSQVLKNEDKNIVPSQENLQVNQTQAIQLDQKAQQNELPKESIGKIARKNSLKVQFERTCKQIIEASEKEGYCKLKKINENTESFNKELAALFSKEDVKMTFTFNHIDLEW